MRKKMSGLEVLVLLVFAASSRSLLAEFGGHEPE